MSGLATLQGAMMRHLLEGDREIVSALDDAMQAPEQRLGIYANAYRERLLGVLSSDYEMLKLWMGEDAFRIAGLSYVEAYPSTSPSLRHFGSRFSDLLQLNHEPITAELCRFERLLLDVYDAADAEQPSAQPLESLPAEAWPGLTLSFHPSVRFFDSHWNSVELWQCLKAQDSPPTLTAIKGKWVLWRNRERVSEFRSLSSFEYAAADYLGAGVRLDEACVALAGNFPDTNIPLVVRDALLRWFGAGIVTAIELSGANSSQSHPQDKLS